MRRRTNSARRRLISRELTRRCGNIFQDLKAKGKPIPVNDIWIAATALECGLELCLFDDHFSNVVLLQFVKP